MNNICLLHQKSTSSFRKVKSAPNLYQNIHHDTHDQTVKIWSSFLNLYRFVTLEIHEFSNIEDIFEKCKGWVNDFLALGSLGRKGFDSVTPYMHFLVYHVPFFTKKYGKLLRFSRKDQ